MGAADEPHRPHLRCYLRQRQPELELADSVRAVLGRVLVIGTPGGSRTLQDHDVDAVAKRDIHALEPLPVHQSRRVLCHALAEHKRTERLLLQSQANGRLCGTRLLAIAFAPRLTNAQELRRKRWCHELPHRHPPVFLVAGHFFVCDLPEDGFDLALRHCLSHHP